MMGEVCARFCFVVRGWACCDGEWVRVWEVGWVGAKMREGESEFFFFLLDEGGGLRGVCY